MGKEVDLLANYPKTKRDTSRRAYCKTEEDRKLARNFGREFFDGDRSHGYGGFTYNPKFWKPVIPTFINYWSLGPESTVLDVGCAKGFMLHDLVDTIPKITIAGIDISQYAIDNSLKSVKNRLCVGDAKKIPFADNSFDVVISINTIHNLGLNDCILALNEIERVSKGQSFITVDAFRTEEEKIRMFEWNLTAKTILSVVEWKNLFRDIGYTGDYFWFIP